MNIRDFIFINKAKSTDRIKILELLGFETETVISHAPEAYVDSNEEVDVDNFELYLEENNDHHSIVFVITNSEDLDFFKKKLKPNRGQKVS